MASGERPLRLLSLDGGGIRGLSIIYILQDVMRRVNLGRSEEERLEPWQYFDMIGGTSTGGIIAIMLGRLKMSLEECKSAYLDLSKEIFTPRKSSYHLIGRGVDFLNANGKFNAEVLEAAIKKIIEGRSTSSEVELLSNPEPECKVFVCTLQSSRYDTTSALLRTYRNDTGADLMSKKFKLWEACRATSAAPTFFDPLVLHDGPITSTFLDGGLTDNNPVSHVYSEAQGVWGRNRRMFLISVGTGDAPSGQFHGNAKNVVQGLAKIATETRITAQQFYNTQQSHPQLAGNYFRLNVSGMGAIGLEEHKWCGENEQATRSYLENGETKTKLEQCTRQLLEAEGQGQAATLNDAELEIIESFVRDLYTRSHKYGDINLVPQHFRNTCEWFLQHPNFVEWQQAKASALWVTADAGCGKSVLARFLIGHLAHGNKVIHFFFRQFRSRMNHLLCALLHQLLMLEIRSPEARSSGMLHMLRDELKFKKGEQVMDEDEQLWNIICNATTTGDEPGSSRLFCIIDGLDECEEQSRSQFINFIVSTFSSSNTTRQPHQPPNFLITSRPYHVIEENFQPLSRIRLRLDEETFEISKDIEMVITDRIQSMNPKRFPSALKQYLHAEISRKAGRTFLWVKLIINALEQLDSTSKKEVRKLLDTNPSELNTLYMDSLSKTNKETTRRLLQILIVAKRPLYLKEVNVALQISEDCACFDDIDLEPDVEGTIKRLCGSVIRITNSTVDFMHQTAREFLIASPSTPEPSQNLAWAASIDLSQAHCVLGSICLRYLALTDWNERLIRFARGKFDIGHIGNEPHEWVRRHGGVHNNTENDRRSEDNDLVDSVPYTHEELDEMRAEVNKISCFYQYAGIYWPHHSETVLRWAKEPGSEPNREFHKFQALLTSFRESGMSRIRRCIGTSYDPFRFLEQDFLSVFDWLSSGPHIEGYTDERILEALAGRLRSEKNVYMRSLFSNEEDTLSILMDVGFPGIWSEAISQYRYDQNDQDAEQTEILEFLLRRSWRISSGSHHPVLVQAIRWRHPCVDFLNRSRQLGQFPGISDEADFHTVAHEMFSVACRYGSPAASLLFERFNSVDDLVLDVNRADLFGVTPLIAAILANDYSLCKWLLRKKADVSVSVSYRNQAVFSGTERLAEMIYPESSEKPSGVSPISRHWNWADCYPSIPNVFRRYGEGDFNTCPLFEAVQAQDPRILHLLLLEYEWNPWQVCANGLSVFETAASLSESRFNQVLDRSRSFDINGTEVLSGRTLLHIAAKHGLWDAMSKLIAEGSTINVQDEKGRTPLHEIASLPPTTGRMPMFRRLVEDHNASANMRNNDRETSLGLLEDSVAERDLSRQDQDQEDYMQTNIFLEQLKTDSTYLPFVRRSAIMRLDESQRNDNVQPVSEGSRWSIAWSNLSDELEDLESGIGSGDELDDNDNVRQGSHNTNPQEEAMDAELKVGNSLFRSGLSPGRRSPYQRICEGISRALRYAGLVDYPPPPGQVRVTWKNRRGKTLYDDYVENEPGAAQALQEYLNQWSPGGVTQGASGDSSMTHSGPVSAPTNYHGSRKGNSGQREGEGESPNHDDSLPEAENSSRDAEAGRQDVDLFLMPCMNSGRYSLQIHPEAVTSIVDDRQLFSALSRSYKQHRGRLRPYWSFVNVQSIHFMKFTYGGPRHIDVRCHYDLCISKPCECIPPRTCVGPDREYRFNPIEPSLSPPIGPRLLMDYFTDPEGPAQDASLVLRQLPKRTSDLSQHQPDELTEAWGIYFKEDWDWIKIWLVLSIGFFPPSLLFGILWAVLKSDIQGAFGVASWWMTGATILVGIVGTCTWKL